MIENFFRTILLAEIIFSLIFAMVILTFYAQRQFKDRRMTTHLTWHVVSMLVTFTLLCVSSFIEIVGRFGQPISWRTPLLLVAFSIAVLGEIFMLNHQIQQRNMVWNRK